MTDNNYRKMGLSRFLMNKVLKDWSNRCDFLYLFANDSVLEFYPKFGFERICEYQHSKAIIKNSVNIKSRKLNIFNPNDYEVLKRCYNLSNPFSVLQVKNNWELLMFYCMFVLKDNVYYIEQYDTIVIAEYDGENMICYEMFCPTCISLNDILSAMIDEKTTRVVFGFTPIDKTKCTVELLDAENTNLFVYKGKENIFEDKQQMFPIISYL